MELLQCCCPVAVLSHQAEESLIACLLMLAMLLYLGLTTPAALSVYVATML